MPALARRRQLLLLALLLLLLLLVVVGSFLRHSSCWQGLLHWALHQAWGLSTAQQHLGQPGAS
jgi:hypothetical protein